MKLFDVYPVYPIEPVKALGDVLWDAQGNEYLDLYGGHAVISIGHSHPYYVAKIKEQIEKIGFYSNSVQIPQQAELAEKLGRMSGYEDYTLFLCNSGAEAIENALKLASFKNGKKRIIAFHKAFHGRTSAAVEATENFAIQAPINRNGHVEFLNMNDEAAVERELQKDDVSAVIIEGIQGVGGVVMPKDDFLVKLRGLCNKYRVELILDEIQSGYGRSGRFFAHQFSGVKPDLITVAKGMGNGFPIAGVLISPEYKASYGLLGTTFGGNHLACVAGNAVLDVIAHEKLIARAEKLGNSFMDALKSVPQVKELRGRGLMVGIEFDFQIDELRKKLLAEYRIFTGNASNKNTLRILPALNVEEKHLDFFVQSLKKLM